MKVLFVDDEENILRGIERTLFMQDCQWDCSFKASGAEALASLEQEPFDAVVSDMRMPGMDGAQLLSEVQQRWPRTIRFILSGYSDTEATVRSFDVAHQFLAKPCDNELLTSRIDRAISLRDLLNKPELADRVGSVGHLPPSPRIYVELARKIADPNSDSKDVAQIIGRDPALSAKLLRLVNSAYFNAVSTVNNIEVAVTRLGMNTIRTLALSCEVFDMDPKNTGVEALQMRALLASTLAERIASSSQLRDAAVTAALLAEVGLLMPELCDDDELDGDEEHIDYCGHAEVGAYLLGLWGLPYEIVEAVALHCDPQRVQGDEFDVIGIVHVAIALAYGKEADLDYLQRTGQLDNWADWQAMRDNLRSQAA